MFFDSCGHACSRIEKTTCLPARESGYKGVYSLIGVVGLVMLIYGYERGVFFDVKVLWVGNEHGWMFFAWLFIVSANVAGLIRKTTRHPMTIGLLIWGLGHAVMNPRPHGLSAWFSLFAVASAVTAAPAERHRVRSISMDLVAVVIAAVATSLSFYFHSGSRASL